MRLTGLESGSEWIDEAAVIGGGCVEDYEEGRWSNARSNLGGIGFS